MRTSTVFFGGIFVLVCGTHLYVMSRMVPYRRDLLDGATGLRRFWDYASQPWGENYSARHYDEPGRRYLLWLRLSGFVAGLALAATVLSLG